MAAPVMRVSPTKRGGPRPASILTGGYDEDRFAAPVPIHFKCPICLDVFREPLICPKEHTFCANCIRTHLSSGHSDCPECQGPLKVEQLQPAPRILRSMLGELKISCCHKDAGCIAVVSLDHLQSHEKTCMFGEQACRYCREEMPSKNIEAHELKCNDRSIVCSKQCGLRVYPNRLPKHDCITALKQQAADLSSQLEQQRIDFQFRQSRLEEYVRRHEAGDRITWARLLAEKVPVQAGNDTFRTSKNPRVPVQRVFEGLAPAKRTVTVPKFSFNPSRKSEHVSLLNDNMTATAINEDSGGSVLGNAVFAGSGVYYWEVRIEAMWDAACSDGSVRVGVVLSDAYDISSALGDDQASIAWWDNIIDGAVFKELSPDVRMSPGSHLGLLLDLNAKKLEFYVDKTLAHELTGLSHGMYIPAFYTRTHADRLSLVLNPSVPLE